jgi:nucleoside-diphosphate-sugar epimerase
MADKGKKVLMTGAAGYIADQMLPTFRERYDTVLIDVTDVNRRGERVQGIIIADLIDPDRSKYARHFKGVDAVVHLGYKRRAGESPLDDFFDEKQNVEMAYNVFRCAYEAGVPRVVMASSNHAADWYEHALIHQRRMEMLEPYRLPLSDNFYGWAKATYEHMGFLFACGAFGADTSGRVQRNVGAGFKPPPTGRKMGVVMVRIGAPRDLELSKYKDDPATYKRDLGAYISPRDLTQLFVKAIETPNIDNEHGIPWQVVYGISNNTRAFWSLTSARQALGYEPEDDSEVKYARDIQSFLIGEGAPGGRVGW